MTCMLLDKHHSSRPPFTAKMSYKHDTANFPIQQCTPSDIPQMYDVFEQAFSAQPTNELIYPSSAVDTEEKREWWLKRYEQKFKKGDVKFFEIVDLSKGKAVAWMKWGFPLEGEGDGVEESKDEKEEEAKGESESASDWPKGTNLEFVERHYGILDGWQKKYVDSQETYGMCYHSQLFLQEDADSGMISVAHFLCTSPEYQRKGFATRLLRLGLGRADQEGRTTYIEASPDG